MTLYAVSSDGTLAVFNFDPEELEGLCPHSVQGSYLKKFGFTPPPIPEGFSHASARQLTPPPSPKASQSQSQSQSQGMDQTGFGNNTGGGERVNVLVAKRGGKKRAGLTNVPMPMASQQVQQQSQSVSSGPVGSPLVGPALTGVSISKRSQLSHQQERAPSVFDVDADTWGASADVRIDTVEEGGRKRKAAASVGVDGEEPKRARTLGGERKRVVVPVKELASGSGAVRAPFSAGAIHLPVPPLMTRIATQVEGSDDVFEAVNPEEDEGASFSLFLLFFSDEMAPAQRFPRCRT